VIVLHRTIARWNDGLLVRFITDNDNHYQQARWNEGLLVRLLLARLLLFDLANCVPRLTHSFRLGAEGLTHSLQVLEGAQGEWCAIGGISLMRFHHDEALAFHNQQKE